MHLKGLSSTVLNWMCFAVCGGMVAAGLWPFNFQAENSAVWGPAIGGLRFSAPPARSKSDLGGIVRTPEPLKFPKPETVRPGDLSIAISLRAAREPDACLQRILDVRRPDGSEAFFIGQWRSYFIVRTFAPQGSGKPHRDAGVGSALTEGRPIRVAVTSSTSGAHLLVDGLPAHDFEMSLLPEGGTLEGHTLYFGNSPDLQCPWSGDIFRFELFGRAAAPADAAAALARMGTDGSSACAQAIACYRFDDPAGLQLSDRSPAGNHLRLDERLFFGKPFLRGVDRESVSASDLAFNLIGFMPFGFLVNLRLRAAGMLSSCRSGWITVALGLALSLAIEWIQVFLPGRDSSLLDLAANTIGTAIAVGMIGMSSNRGEHRMPIFAVFP
jgi:hypothetical protein